MATGRDLAIMNAKRVGLPEEFLLRLVQQESGWNPNAKSRVGAMGLGQVMPATAASPGFGITPLKDPWNPEENLRFTADYAKALYDRYGGDTRLTAAAYNAGAGTVDKYRAGKLSSLPAETQDYIQKVALPQDLGQVASAAAPQGDGSMLNMALPQRPPSLMETPTTSISPATLTEEEKTPAAQFHPGLGLQSLGAAIAAGSQGQSAAEALGGIRNAYFEEQAANQKREQEILARKAAVGIMGGPDSALGQAVAAGMPLEQAMQVYSQERGFAHDYDMADRGYLSSRALQDDQQVFSAAQQTQQLGQANDQFQQEFGLKKRSQEIGEATMYATGQAAKAAVVRAAKATGNDAFANQMEALPETAFADPSMTKNLIDTMAAPAAGDDPLKRANEIVATYGLADKLRASGQTELADALVGDLKKGGQTINVNNGDGLPGLGKLGTDQAYVVDENGKPVLDAQGRAQAYTVPGTKTYIEEQKLQREEATAKSNAASGDMADLSNASFMWKTLNEAEQEANGATAGFFGSMLANVNGTPAKDLQERLKTVTGNVSFDTLMAMKKASPTGGALGSVSERELDLLSTAKGSLAQGQSPQRLRENISALKSHYETIAKKIVSSGASAEEKVRALAAMGIDPAYANSDKKTEPAAATGAPAVYTPPANVSSILDKYKAK